MVACREQYRGATLSDDRLTENRYRLAIASDKTGTFELYDLRITVTSIEGRPTCGLEVGDYFEVTESSRVRIPAGKHFCLYAMACILPLLPAKQRQLDANDWLERDSLVACPDPDERLVMRIERIARRRLLTSDFT